MKKLISILLSLILFVSLPFVNVNASDEKSNDSSMETTGLLNALGIDVVTEKGDTVSRAEFVYIVAKCLSYTSGQDSQTTFTDVPNDSYYSGAVKYALDSKLISPSGLFYPANPIRVSEACKIIVSALGLDYHAIAHGGWPTGYLYTANDFGLIKGLGGEEYLSYSDTFELIDRFLHSDVYTQTGYTTDPEKSVTFTKRGTVLKVYHNVDILYGAKVTSTVFTGLYEEESACGLGEIEIDKKVYKYYGNSVNLIGKSGNVYYKEMHPLSEVVYIKLSDEKTVVVDSEDIYEASFQTVGYADGSKDKKIRLISSPSFIYNNCANPGYLLSDLLSAEGEVSFIDSDNNGVYDVVYVNECVIEAVSDVDVYNNAISCKGNTYIPFDNSESVYSFIKNGKVCDISEIAPGDIIQIYASKVEEGKTPKAITVVVSRKGTISGQVTGIDENNNVIYIDDVPYGYISSFKINDLSKCTVGTSVTLGLSDRGIVGICVNNETETQYGYFIAAKAQGGISNDIQFKMLDSMGNVAVYTLADKVKYNGVYESAQKVYNEFKDEEEQVFRYVATIDKEIRMIDTQDAEGMLTDDADPDDSLTLYKFPTANLYSVWYISSTQMLHPYFKTGDKTTVFRIGNENMEDSKRYIKTTLGTFFSSVRGVDPQKIKAYDVPETGDAGAVVLYTDSVGEKIRDTAPYGIVYSANPAINKGGDVSVSIVVYNKGKYARYYINDETVLKNINPDASFQNCPIKKGDYVRFNADETGAITGLDIDYSITDGVKAEFSAANSQHLASPCYYYGRVYDKDGTNVSVVTENIPGITNGITDATHRYRFNLPATLTVYDSENRIVYEGNSGEILTYLQSPEKCSRILIMTDEGRMKNVVLYK